VRLGIRPPLCGCKRASVVLLLIPIAGTFQVRSEGRVVYLAGSALQLSLCSHWRGGSLIFDTNDLDDYPPVPIRAPLKRILSCPCVVDAARGVLYSL